MFFTGLKTVAIGMCDNLQQKMLTKSFENESFSNSRVSQQMDYKFDSKRFLSL